MSAAWYLARLRAMSPPEVAWRAGHTLTRRIRTPRRPPLPDWTSGAWCEALPALVTSAGDELVATASRIAAGELQFWGRSARWDEDPPGSDGPDIKPILELHRQQHIVPLAAGAHVAGRDDWARLALDQLLGWIARNPAGQRPAWISGYEASHRLVGWAWALPLIAPKATAAELVWIGEAYAAHAALAAATPSRYSSANNHRLVELTGLLAASAVGTDVAPWHELWGELERELHRQTFADGGSREQAGGYFLYVLETLWVAALFARAGGHELGNVGERLRLMLAWLDATAGDDGEPPPVGDDAEDRMLRLEYFEDRKARVIAGRVEALLDGAPSLDAARQAAPPSSRVLRDSGLAVLRAPRARVVFDVGELGYGSLAAHGHADALSLLLDVDGKAVLRDSGTGAYAPPSVREPFRTTLAHNTVVVDGRSQAVSEGPHLWGRRFRVEIEAAALGPGLDYVRASHDGYRRSPARALHTRSVLLLRPDVVVVLDRVQAERPCSATLVWQGPRDRELPVEVAAVPAAALADGTGPWSPRYTWLDDAPRRLWTADGTDVVFASVAPIGAAHMTITSLQHAGGVTRLAVDGARTVTVQETWAAPEPVVD